MKIKELIDKLKDFEDFDLDLKFHFNVSDEELKNRPYPYPYDNYVLEIDDIGYSENIVNLSVSVDWDN